jgi:hypothetical protein
MKSQPKQLLKSARKIEFFHCYCFTMSLDVFDNISATYSMILKLA